jgi:hypothetical protein
MTRLHVRGDANITQRRLLQATTFNLCLVMRKRFKAGTPRDYGGLMEAVCSVISLPWTAIIPFHLGVNVVSGENRRTHRGRYRLTEKSDNLHFRVRILGRWNLGSMTVCLEIWLMQVRLVVVATSSRRRNGHRRPYNRVYWQTDHQRPGTGVRRPPLASIGTMTAKLEITDADLPSASLGRLRLAGVDTSNHVCVCVFT